VFNVPAFGRRGIVRLFYAGAERDALRQIHALRSSWGRAMTTTTLLLRVAVRGLEPTLFRFPRAEVTVGRLDTNDLFLGDSSVSDRHARILKRDDKFIAVDLKSETGTYINGRRMTAPTIVREGDVLSIGAYDIDVLHHEPRGEREQLFLDTLTRDPKDDDTRTVYSDWLEQEGRHEEAELVRAQLAIKNVADDDPRFYELSKIIHELAPKMAPAWRRTLAREPIERCPVRFEVLCPKRWDALTPTDDPHRRYCDGCKKDVHYAPTVNEASAFALQGKCVVVDITQPRHDGDLEPPPRVMMAGRIAPPLPPPPPPDTE